MAEWCKACEADPEVDAVLEQVWVDIGECIKDLESARVRNACYGRDSEIAMAINSLREARAPISPLVWSRNE